MRTALVTGGSRGIGNSIAALFSRNKWSVLTCARSEITSTKNVHSFQVDLGLLKDRVSFLKKIKSELNNLELLVLNAAVTGISYLDEKKVNARYVHSVNVKANEDLLEYTLPYLEKNCGTVVFLTSNTVREKNAARSELFLYRKTKIDFEKILKKFAKKNPRVHFVVLNPGKVSGRVHNNIIAHGEGFLFQRTMQAILDKTFRKPKDVASFLKQYMDKKRDVSESNLEYIVL